MISKLFFESVKVTEEAAIAAAAWIGKGDEYSADQAAVNAMRKALNELAIEGVVVIGEGERDEAPMLYIGEKIGQGGVKIDIAVDPLEGTTICAHAAPNSIAVMALAESGGFLHAPDVYMNKIAIGPGLPENIIDLDNSPKQNLANLAKAKKCAISDLKVMVLNRARHEELIMKIREAGARIELIGDGDVSAVIATAMPGNVDIYMGIGGAPEGVLAAAALKSLGGQMMTRLIFSKEDERNRAKIMGITDLNRKYLIEDLAKGNVIFVATGVTSGAMLEGVKLLPNNYVSLNSIIMNSATGTITNIKNHRLL